MKRAVATAACLLMSAKLAVAEVITVVYEGRAGTVAQKPFGLTVPLNTPITGYFTFDTSTPDQAPDDEYSGEYQHDGNAGFLAEFLGTRITGSDSPFYEVRLVEGNPAADNFLVYDGPRANGHQGGVMSIDGVPDEDIRMDWLGPEDLFETDELIDPFPLYDFEPLGSTYTFSLKDDQGTILLRLSKATEVECGDVNGAGISAGDALAVLRAAVGSTECLPCVCDVDGSGAIGAPDALRTLRVSVGAAVTLDCSYCL